MSGLHLEFVAVDAGSTVTMKWRGRVVCVDGEFFFTATGAARTMTLKSSVFDDHPRSGFDVVHEIYALVEQRAAIDICSRCEQEPESRYTD